MDSQAISFSRWSQCSLPGLGSAEGGTRAAARRSRMAPAAASTPADTHRLAEAMVAPWMPSRPVFEPRYTIGMFTPEAAAEYAEAHR